MMLDKASRLIGNAVVRPLSGLSRRNRNFWLFGHQGGEFAGNSKYLYLWVHGHRPDIQTMWITHLPRVAAELRAHGLPVCVRGSASSARAALKAGVYLYCHGPEDVSVALGAGAVLINLWHGIGLKTTHYGDPRSNASIYSNPNLGWARRTLGLSSRLEPDLLITTSKFTQAHFADQFRLPLERCPPCGYPRLECERDEPLRTLVEDFEGSKLATLRRDEPSEVYVYAPTYRDSARDFLDQAIPSRSQLNAILEHRNALLYLKLHPHTAAPSHWPEERIRLWPKEVDLYSVLPSIDCLITDYSSLHYDWIFHSDRGAVLYTFDEDEYDRHDRNLLYPFDENVAGWRARSFDELLGLIASGKALDAHPDVPKVREKFWGPLSEAACALVVAAIEERLRV